MRPFEVFHGLSQFVRKSIEIFRTFLRASRFVRRSLDQTSDAFGMLAVGL